MEEAWRYDTPYYGNMVLAAPPHLQHLVGLHRIPWAVLERRLGFLPGELAHPPCVPGLTLAHTYSLRDAVTVAGDLPQDLSHLSPAEQDIALAAEVDYHRLMDDTPGLSSLAVLDQLSSYT